MRAVVLIGGKGTRLRPVTWTVPKAMLPLCNKPYISYLIDSLKKAGLDGAVLAMGYLPDPIQRYFAGVNLDGFTLDYVVEEQPLGTAGGIKNAEKYLDDGPFLALNGDILTGADLSEVVAAHLDRRPLATINLTSVEDPRAYGLVEVDDRLRVKRFVEKPGTDEVRTSLINAGVYVLERQVLEMIPEGCEVSMEREIFPWLQALGQLRAYVSSAYWRDIGTPRSYLAASHDILSGAVGSDKGFRYTSVHRSAEIAEGAALLRPVCVAEGCKIGARASVGGRTSVGRGCVIEEDVVVEGSILFDGVRVGKGSVIRSSIVGPGADIRAGCVVCDLSVLGAGCVVEEGNVLSHGARVNPRVSLPREAISF